MRFCVYLEVFLNKLRTNNKFSRFKILKYASFYYHLFSRSLNGQIGWIRNWSKHDSTNQRPDAKRMNPDRQNSKETLNQVKFNFTKLKCKKTHS